MRYYELLEDEQKQKGVDKLAVIYGGRFQPPHVGHNAVYQFLVKLFGKDVVYIATSNKTDLALLDKYHTSVKQYQTKLQDYEEKLSKGKKATEPKKPVMPEIKSFFNFEEKQLIWNKMFGVNNNQIAFSAIPAFNPHEILSKLGDKTAYVAVTSEKDADRYKSKDFYIEYPFENGRPVDFNKIKNDLYPYSEKGYYIILPSLEGGISATKVRSIFTSGDEIETKKQKFKQAYKNYDESVFTLINTKLSGDQNG